MFSFQLFKVKCCNPFIKGYQLCLAVSLLGRHQEGISFKNDFDVLPDLVVDLLLPL